MCLRLSQKIDKGNVRGIGAGNPRLKLLHKCNDLLTMATRTLTQVPKAMKFQKPQSLLGQGFVYRANLGFGFFNLRQRRLLNMIALLAGIESFISELFFVEEVAQNCAEAIMITNTFSKP
jgi:hypothetical protein